MTSTQTTTTTFQEEQLRLRVRGINDERAALIEEHSAHQQPATETNPGRRADREYRVAYEGDSPANWPQTRGCPPYRPLDAALDVSRRPWAANPQEILFVRGMLTGVFVMGLVNSGWRSTIGRVTDKIWEYPIGGQY